MRKRNVGAEASRPATWTGCRPVNACRLASRREGTALRGYLPWSMQSGLLLHSPASGVRVLRSGVPIEIITVVWMAVDGAVAFGARLVAGSPAAP